MQIEGKGQEEKQHTGGDRNEKEAKPSLIGTGGKGTYLAWVENGTVPYCHVYAGASSNVAVAEDEEEGGWMRMLA